MAAARALAAGGVATVYVGPGDALATRESAADAGAIGSVRDPNCIDSVCFPRLSWWN